MSGLPVDSGSGRTRFGTSPQGLKYHPTSCGQRVDNMAATVTKLVPRTEALWREYLAAKSKAEASNRIEDGIAASRAWSRWLDLFMTETQRSYLKGAAS